MFGWSCPRPCHSLCGCACRPALCATHHCNALRSSRGLTYTHRPIKPWDVGAETRSRGTLPLCSFGSSLEVTAMRRCKALVWQQKRYRDGRRRAPGAGASARNVGRMCARVESSAPYRHGALARSGQDAHVVPPCRKHHHGSPPASFIAPVCVVGCWEVAVAFDVVHGSLAIQRWSRQNS